MTTSNTQSGPVKAKPYTFLLSDNLAVRKAQQERLGASQYRRVLVDATDGFQQKVIVKQLSDGSWQMNIGCHERPLSWWLGDEGKKAITDHYGAFSDQVSGPVIDHFRFGTVTRGDTGYSLGAGGKFDKVTLRPIGKDGNWLPGVGEFKVYPELGEVLEKLAKRIAKESAEAYAKANEALIESKANSNRLYATIVALTKHLKSIK